MSLSVEASPSESTWHNILNRPMDDRLQGHLWPAPCFMCCTLKMSEHKLAILADTSITFLIRHRRHLVTPLGRISPHGPIVCKASIFAISGFIASTYFLASLEQGHDNRPKSLTTDTLKMSENTRKYSQTSMTLLMAHLLGNGSLTTEKLMHAKRIRATHSTNCVQTLFELMWLLQLRSDAAS